MSGKMDYFKKYPKIENSYRQKNIIQWMRHFPQLYNEPVVLQEKLHGANIQFEIHPDGTMRIYSRKQFLGEIMLIQNDTFTMLDEPHEIRFQKADITEIITTMPSYLKLFHKLLALAKNENSVLRAYGELCGPKIQKGVYYCDHPMIFFFDISIGGEFYSPALFYSLCYPQGDIVTPIISPAENVYEAIDIDIDNVLSFYDTPENYIEGVVIKPCFNTYQTDRGIFYLKKKNSKFEEKQKSPKERKPIDENLKRLNEEFQKYIVPNRVQSVFSKHGPIERDEDLGFYIKAVMEDAQEDFDKDFEDELSQLKKGELKTVYKVGGTVASLLKTYLKEGDFFTETVK